MSAHYTAAQSKAAEEEDSRQAEFDGFTCQSGPRKRVFYVVDIPPVYTPMVRSFSKAQKKVQKCIHMCN